MRILLPNTWRIFKIDTESFINYLKLGLTLEQTKQIMNLERVSNESLIQRTLNKDLQSLYPKYCVMILLECQHIGYLINRKLMNKHLIGNLYTIILVVGSLIMSVLYHLKLKPVIFDQMQSIVLLSQGITLIELVNLILVFMTLIGIFASVFFLIVLKSKRATMFFMISFKDCIISKLIKQKLSLELCMLYQLFHKNDYSTLNALEAMKKIRVNSIMSWITYHFEFKMKEGHSFTNCFEIPYLSNSLKILIRNCEFEYNFAESLEKIIATLTIEIDMTAKKIVNFIHIFAYIHVGITVSMISNLMMIPLKIMEGI